MILLDWTVNGLAPTHQKGTALENITATLTVRFKEVEESQIRTAL